MKYCKGNIYEYIGFNGTPTTVKFISSKEVLDFHGKEFFNKFSEFASNLPKVKVNNEDCYFYIDYKEKALTTEMWINC